MQKVILVSILALTVIVPLVAARERSPSLALRKAVVWMLVGIAAYVLIVLFVYPRFLG